MTLTLVPKEQSYQRNTHVKCESSIPYHLKVMANAKVFFCTHLKVMANIKVFLYPNKQRNTQTAQKLYPLHLSIQGHKKEWKKRCKMHLCDVLYQGHYKLMDAYINLT